MAVGALGQPRPRTLVAAVFGSAALIALALIAASLAGARGEADDTALAAKPGRAAPVGAAETATLLRGIPQDGTVLGSPTAPVTLVEYADLQCPYCAQWSRQAFPEIVRKYVRSGRVRLVFRGLAFLGPDSDTALRAALAAGRQGRLWHVLHLLYANQGFENSGWVTEDLLGAVAGAVPGLEAGLPPQARASAGVERELRRAELAAEQAGIGGTPAFEVGPTRGRLEPLEVTSLDAAPFEERLGELLGP